MCEALVVAYEARIRRLAEKTARQDADVADDLAQVARIAVWQLDPGRVHTNEQAVVMRVALDAMRMWLRQERRARLITPPQRPVPARRPQPPDERHHIVPIRRFAPRHLDAAPLDERRAA